MNQPVSQLNTRAVEVFDGERAGVKVGETVEVDHRHVVPVAIVTVGEGLYPASLTESVVDMVFIEVVSGEIISATFEGKLLVRYESE